MEQIQIEKLRGLNPQAWICVGEGINREDVKASLLSRGIGLTGPSVSTLDSICKIIVEKGLGRPIRILAKSSREEILRELFKNRGISEAVPELKRLRRQRTFFGRLDEALQNGRLCFGHDEEERVMEERLEAQVGTNRLRHEVRLFSLGYEAWLKAKDCYDLPLLLQTAIEILQDPSFAHLFPETIYVLTGTKMESRESLFWETLGRIISVQIVELESAPKEEVVQWSWERWHTFDDAAESLARRLIAEKDERPLAENIILIPDLPEIRMSLNRSLADYQIPLFDERDPTAIRRAEWVKTALLPLECVAQTFERKIVISYLNDWLASEVPFDERARWIRHSGMAGVHRGLSSYKTQSLLPLYEKLLSLNQLFGKRLFAEELADRHLRLLEPLGVQVFSFFERIWSELIEDLKLLDHTPRRAPLLFWLEKIKLRIEDASPPIQPLKSRTGVKIYRLSQMEFEAANPERSKLWVLGLPPGYFDPDLSGDYWFSEREREILSAEFQVQSGIQKREQRLAAFQSWLAKTKEVVLLDSHYSWNAREREELLPTLKQIPGFPLIEPEDKGASPRWLSGFSLIERIPPQNVQLSTSRLGESISASTLDQYSRCAFSALARNVWKLDELKDPQSELWPEAKGTLMHKAVELMKREALSPEEALERAWTTEKPKGLYAYKKVKRQSIRQMTKLLKTFALKEQEFLERSGTQVFKLEDQEVLELQLKDGSLHGRPDRIDEHPDGLFIIDYKTASSPQPSAKEMIEKGYRLQLAVYALAARKKYAQEIVGAQFIQLDRKGTRSRGIFFKKYNGAKKGNLTQTTARSHSLVDREPESVWAELEEKVSEELSHFKQGIFNAAPKYEKECSTCFAIDLCGKRRLVESLTVAPAEEEQGGESE